MTKISLSGSLLGHVDEDHGLIVRVVASRAIGHVTDANGQEFNLTPEVLRTIVDNYNRRVHQEHQETIIDKKRIPIGKKILERIMGKPREHFTINDVALLPVQLEHELHVKSTIGTVVGLLELGDYDGAQCIYANLLISDVDAIKRIHDGRLHQVSISFSYPDLETDEISFTVYGAIEKSNIIAIRENDKMSYSKQEKPILTSPPPVAFGHDVGKIQLRMQQIEKDKVELKKRKEQLLFKKENKNIALDLVRHGKIYAKFKDFIADDFSKFSSRKDRDIALRIFKTMPSVIKAPRNLNTLAFKAEELLMSANLKEKAIEMNKSFYEAAEIREQLRIDLRRNKKLSSTPAEGKEDVEREGKDADMSEHEELIKKGHDLSLDSMEKHIHGPEHEADFKARLSEHTKKGNFKEAYEECCKFYGMDMSESATVDIKPNEVNQVPLSNSEGEEEDKKTEKELEELEKKEADMSQEGEGLVKDLEALVKKYAK